MIILVCGEYFRFFLTYKWCMMTTINSTSLKFYIISITIFTIMNIVLFNIIIIIRKIVFLFLYRLYYSPTSNHGIHNKV